MSVPNYVCAAYVPTECTVLLLGSATVPNNQQDTTYVSWNTSKVMVTLELCSFFLWPVKILQVIYYLYKIKAIPLQVWTGPEVSRRMRLPNFKTICT